MIDPKAELLALKGTTPWRQFAVQLGMKHSYLWQVSQGNLPASDRLLEKLGLRVTYERIGTTSAGTNGKDRKRGASSRNGA